VTALLLAAALVAAEQPAGRYEALVQQGIALGRSQQMAEAQATLDQAISLDPQRPEAWVERGGLHFLSGEYAAAVADLEQALRRHEDPYTRDLLASALALAGHTDEALSVWNVMGQPLLQTVDVKGLIRTRYRVVRRELPAQEGAMLDRDAVAESRLRLQELGIFDRVTVRPVPRGDGKADLQVAVLERPLLFSGPIDAALAMAAGILGDSRVRLRANNVGGLAASIVGQYRWQHNRPDLSLGMDWAQPLGLPANFHILAFRGRQLYALPVPITRRSRGLDAGLRRVLGARTIGQIGFKTRDRTFSRPDPIAPPGRIAGLELGLERRLVETRQQRLGVVARVFETWHGLGSDLSYDRTLLVVDYRGDLEPVDAPPLERSTVAVQLRWGRGSGGLPLDEMFAPGGSLDMDFPLRGHRQLRDGALGGTPMGRGLLLANVEWRHRVWSRGAFQLGIAPFTDVARVSDTASHDPHTLMIDAGVGLRIALRGGAVFRIDAGHGLLDGRNAVSAGLGQTF
jgi:hypothetical protein